MDRRRDVLYSICGFQHTKEVVNLDALISVVLEVPSARYNKEAKIIFRSWKCECCFVSVGEESASANR